MIQRIYPDEVKARLDAGEGIYFLDVREPWEYEHCRIGESELIPLGELHHRLEDVVVADGTLIVVYCHHGIRSLSGAAILANAGMKNVASLQGGIELWSQTVDPSVPRY